jgi:hypothetical protein
MQKQLHLGRAGGVAQADHAPAGRDHEPVRRGRARRILVVAILVTGCAALAGYSGYRWLLARINAFAEETPDPLLGSSLSPRDQKRLYGRLAAFRTALESRRPAPRLTLTTGEINALLNVAPGLGGKVRAEVDGSTVRAQFSLPLEDLGFPQWRGRYLNGTSVLSLSVVEGELCVRPEAITARAGPLPEVIMARLRKANLARLAFRDPRVAKTLRRLSRVEVRPGAIDIMAR